MIRSFGDSNLNDKIALGGGDKKQSDLINIILKFGTRTGSEGYG